MKRQVTDLRELQGLHPHLAAAGRSGDAHRHRSPEASHCRRPAGRCWQPARLFRDRAAELCVYIFDRGGAAGLRCGMSASGCVACADCYRGVVRVGRGWGWARSDYVIREVTLIGGDAGEGGGMLGLRYYLFVFFTDVGKKDERIKSGGTDRSLSNLVATTWPKV